MWLFEFHEENYAGLRTGDILLCSADPLIARSYSSQAFMIASLQRWMLRRKFTHVGMIYIRDGEHLLWESDINLAHDLETNTRYAGCRILDLKERINNYPGEVWYSRIRINDHEERQAELEEGLAMSIRKYHGRPYESKRREFIRIFYDGIGGHNKTNTHEMFCSELVAATLQHMGLLKLPPEGPPSNEYGPNDFSINGRGMPLDLRNATLSHYVPLKSRLIRS